MNKEASILYWSLFTKQEKEKKVLKTFIGKDKPYSFFDTVIIPMETFCLA